MGKATTNQYGLPKSEYTALMNEVKAISVLKRNTEKLRADLAKRRIEMGKMLIHLRDVVQQYKSQGYNFPAFGKFVHDTLGIGESATSSLIGNATLQQRLIDKQIIVVHQRQTVLSSFRNIQREYGEAYLFKFIKNIKGYDKFVFLEDHDIGTAVIEQGVAKIKTKIITIVQIRNTCNAIIENRYCLTDASKKEALTLFGKCINILSK